MAKCTLKKEGQDWQKLNVKDAWEKPPPCAASQKMARGGGWWVQNDMAEQWWRWWWWIVCLRESADPKTSEGPFGSWLTCDSSILWQTEQSTGRREDAISQPRPPLDLWPPAPYVPFSAWAKKKKIDKGSWGSCWGLFWLVWLTSGAWISTKVLH